MRHGITALLAGSLFLVGCGSKGPDQAKEQPPAAASAPAQASTPAAPAASPEQAKVQPPAAPPAAGPASAPAEAAPATQTPTAVPVEPPKPPQPKTYTIATGTSIGVRTLAAVDTKHTKTENEFETTLVDSLTVDGHTLAKPGATVIGTVVNADQGGRVKGKALPHARSVACSSLFRALSGDSHRHRERASQERHEEECDPDRIDGGWGCGDRRHRRWRQRCGDRGGCGWRRRRRHKPGNTRPGR